MSVYRTSASVTIIGNETTQTKIERALAGNSELAAVREMKRIADKLINNNKYPGFVTDIAAKKIA